MPKVAVLSWEQSLQSSRPARGQGVKTKLGSELDHIQDPMSGAEGGAQARLSTSSVFVLWFYVKAQYKNILRT